MPELIKVGYSMKDPKIRARELDSSAFPYPFVVEYEMHIGNPQEIEQQVHHVLSFYREGKEWYRCSCKEAIEAIRKVAGKKAIYEVDMWEDLDKLADPKDKEEFAFEKQRTINLVEELKQNIDLPESKRNNIERIKSVENIKVVCQRCLKQYSVTLRRCENQAICPFCGGCTEVNVKW